MYACINLHTYLFIYLCIYLSIYLSIIFTMYLFNHLCIDQLSFLPIRMSLPHYPTYTLHIFPPSTHTLSPKHTLLPFLPQHTHTHTISTHTHTHTHTLLPFLSPNTPVPPPISSPGKVSVSFALPDLPQPGWWRVRVSARGQQQEKQFLVHKLYEPLYEVG